MSFKLFKGFLERKHFVNNVFTLAKALDVSLGTSEQKAEIKTPNPKIVANVRKQTQPTL